MQTCYLETEAILNNENGGAFREELEEAGWNKILNNGVRIWTQYAYNRG